MNILFFDIEANGLLDTVSQVHCLEMQNSYGDACSCTSKEVETGIETLKEAEALCAHSAIKYDCAAIDKLYGTNLSAKKIIDTVNLSRLIYPDIGTRDVGLRPPMPKKLIGKHSLEAWGFRLGILKGEFGKQDNWEEWSQEMQDYCKLDVKILRALYLHLMSKEPSQESIDLEMEFQKIIFRQEQHGFPFNIEKARKLEKFLEAEKESLEKQLGKFVTHLEIASEFTPKKDNEKKGWIAGKPIVRIKREPFNYGSRLQIVKYLRDKYQWHPVDFTDKGNVELSAEVLNSLPWEEAKLFAKLFDVQKVQTRLSSGPKSWINAYRDGRVYGEMITNGAVTGRCTHKVVANIAKVSSYLGAEVRELFEGLPGWKQVGCDAKGIELRMLAHYMSHYDGGEYAKIVTEGDVHTSNQKATGLETRDKAKTFIYAFLYGAGDANLGNLLKPEGSLDQKKLAGKTARAKFLQGFPALDALIKDVHKRVKDRGFILGLDGRKLECRSQHSSLNTLLQSCGAIIMKRACIILWELLEAEGYQYGRDVVQLIHYHDEWQLSCREEITQRVGEISATAIEKAGEYYKMKCRLEGDFKIGNNWKECH